MITRLSADERVTHVGEETKASAAGEVAVASVLVELGSRVVVEEGVVDDSAWAGVDDDVGAASEDEAKGWELEGAEEEEEEAGGA